MADELRSRLADLPTDELMDILRSHDVEQWRPEVFPIIEALLRERGVDVTRLEIGDEPTPGPEDADLESVASFGDAMTAHLSRMALCETGIDAWLSPEHLAGVSPPLGLAIGIDLLVRRGDAAGARELLASLEAGAAALPSDAEPCPRCQSTETEHSQRSDRISAVTGFLLVGYPRPASVWRWTCNDCGHEWE